MILHNLLKKMLSEIFIRSYCNYFPKIQTGAQFLLAMHRGH
jgi:hypothetical protein